MRPLLLFVACCFSLSTFSQNADIAILKSINLGRNKQLDPAFIGVTNSVTPVSIAVPVTVLTVGLIKRDNSIKNKGLCIGVSLIVAAGVSTGLKYSVKRTRPFVTYPFIDKATSGGSPSFPSGHTSDAFATATSLSLAFPKWYVIAPSYAWACTVGYSRMHLGVHYPSDVLAGAITGAGSAYLCYRLNKWLFEPRRERVVDYN